MGSRGSGTNRFGFGCFRLFRCWTGEQLANELATALAWPQTPLARQKRRPAKRRGALGYYREERYVSLCMWIRGR
jgi:hypothetical protein